MSVLSLARLVALVLRLAVAVVLLLLVAHSYAAQGPAVHQPVREFVIARSADFDPMDVAATPDPQPGLQPNPEPGVSAQPGPPPSPHASPPPSPQLKAPEPIPPANPPGSDPAFWDIPGQVEAAINGWLGDVAKSVLTPVLALIGQTVLATPDLTQGRIEQVWDMTAGLADACYVLLVVAGGLLMMGYETVQTRWAVKQIGARLVFAFIAANCSLVLIRQSLSFVNALTGALFTQDVSAAGIGDRLTSAILDSIFLPDGTTAVFAVLLGLVLSALAVAVLVSFALRTAGLLLITVLAPLMLSCHALPGLDGVARVWWRCLGAVYGTQLLQATVLMLMIQVFFDPNADVFGIPTASGVTDLLVCCALFVLLLKIPGWMRHAALGRSGGGGGLVRTVARAAVFATVGSTLGLGTATSARSLVGRAVTRGVAARFGSGPGGLGGAGRSVRLSRQPKPPTPVRPKTDPYTVDPTKEYPGGRDQIPGQLALFPVPREARVAKPRVNAPETETAASAVYPGQSALFPPPVTGFARQQPLFTVPKEWRVAKQPAQSEPRAPAGPAVPATKSAGPRHVQPGLFSPSGQLYATPVQRTPGQVKKARIDAARRRAAQQPGASTQPSPRRAPGAASDPRDKKDGAK